MTILSPPKILSSRLNKRGSRWWSLLCLKTLLFLSIAADASGYFANSAHLYVHDLCALLLVPVGVWLVPRKKIREPWYKITPTKFLAFLFVDTLVFGAVNYFLIPRNELKLWLFEAGDGLRIVGELWLWCWTIRRLKPTFYELGTIFGTILGAIAISVAVRTALIATHTLRHDGTTSFDLLVLIGIPLGLAFLVVNWQWKTLVAFVALLPGTLFLYSRTALVGSGVASFVVLLSIRVRRVVVALCAVVFVVLFVILAPSATLTRARSIFNPALVPYTIPTRLIIWKDAVRIWWTSPVVGVGYRGYGLYSRISENKDNAGAGTPSLFSNRIKEAHNDYLSALAETGLLGFVIFLFFWLSVLRRGFVMWLRPQGVDRPIAGFMLGLILGILAVSISGEVLIPRTPAWMPAAIVWWIIASVLTLPETAVQP